MVIQSFNETLKDDNDALIITIDGVDYEGFTSIVRVDRNTIPDDWYVYDMRHNDEGDICEIKNGYIIANHHSTFCTQDKLPLEKGKSLYLGEGFEYTYA
jgi:hypothetical protein